MNCPNENTEMQQVKVESHYGQTVLLDQCPKCGGIWFDHLELYSVKQGQAEKIDLLSTDALQSSSLIENNDLHCPRDSVKLEYFSDAYFPEDIILARCPACNGFWLNRGEFTKYQDFRRSLKKPREKTEADAKLGKDIEYILSAQQTGGVTDTLGNLGKFLGTPMDSTTWQPLEPDQLSVQERNRIDMALNILFILLRFFIHI
jgi:Zn-finger nucleic acid-binding protein